MYQDYQLGTPNMRCSSNMFIHEHRYLLQVQIDTKSQPAAAVHEPMSSQHHFLDHPM